MASPPRSVPTDEAVTALLAGLAAEAHGRTEELTGLVTGAIAAAEPQLGADEAIASDLRRSVQANVELGLLLLARPEVPIEQTSAPPEAIELATSMLRRGVEPGALIQAYRVGQNAFWRWWMDDVADHVDDPRVLIAALDHSSARLFGYLDSVISRLLRHYQEERERWLGGALARRAEVLHAILAGDDDTAAASRALGFELERPLLALALWRTDDPPPAEHPLDGLERLAQAIAAALGAGRALTLPAGSTTLWAWIGSGALDRAAEAAETARGPAEAVALGGPAAGAAGLRDAHRDAREARRVARLAGDAAVVRHDEVEIAALVSADPDGLRRFVARTLGPLAEDAPGPARLRDSLGAWFAAGGNARVAAEALGTHKNTVLYRVRRAEDLLGRPLGTGALDVQVALEAVRRLGAGARP
jgi:hypothetical protein